MKFSISLQSLARYPSTDNGDLVQRRIPVISRKFAYVVHMFHAGDNVSKDRVAALRGTVFAFLPIKMSSLTVRGDNVELTTICIYPSMCRCNGSHGVFKAIFMLLGNCPVLFL